MDGDKPTDEAMRAARGWYPGLTHRSAIRRMARSIDRNTHLPELLAVAEAALAHSCDAHWEFSAEPMGSCLMCAALAALDAARERD